MKTDFAMVPKNTPATELPKPESSYQLVPNLYKDNFTARITLGEDESGLVEIYTIDGRLMGMHKIASGIHQLDLSSDGLVAGVYLYKVTIGNETKTNGKLVVVK